MGQKVAILGASKKPERFSYQAFRSLQEYGHTPLPVSPKFSELEGVTAFASLSLIPFPVDTLTMYVGPELSTELQSEIIALKPGRVIFNPGSENPTLAKALRDAVIPVLEACTLVLLRSGQFDLK